MNRGDTMLDQMGKLTEWNELIIELCYKAH